MTDTVSTIRNGLGVQYENEARIMHEFYRSSNGDTWKLISKGSPAKSIIRHTANQSSGGTVTDLSEEQFLAINNQGPEHQALRALSKAEG